MCRNKKWVKIITIKQLSDIASSTWKETKPLMILKPDMPDVSASSVKLEEVEVNTDAYKAQLVQQKAKRVEAAEALLSKANQDPLSRKHIPRMHAAGAAGVVAGGAAKPPTKMTRNLVQPLLMMNIRRAWVMSMLMKSQAKVMKGIPSPKTAEKVVRLMARRSTRERHSPMMS
jgi:hypothetical protein